MVGDPQQGGLEGVDGLDGDLVAGCDLDALEEVLGVERDGEVGALELGVEALVGLADVLGDRHELEAVVGHGQPHRGGLAGEQLHAADRFEEHLAADGEAVGLGLRDEPLVGRELALDQHGGETGAADLEAGLPLPQADRRGPRRRPAAERAPGGPGTAPARAGPR